MLNVCKACRNLFILKIILVAVHKLHKRMALTYDLFQGQLALHSYLLEIANHQQSLLLEFCIVYQRIVWILAKYLVSIVL